FVVVVVLVAVVLLASLMVGRTFYPPADVLRVMLGQDVPGATFTVGRMRLPRAVLAVVAGACFCLGGVGFQAMLRNPLVL
ncbi:iron chelate uptake ABC transporter family permease subunit, partial [Cellulomonas sp. GbtcB1]|uniref:iron chelate uptake ABC transporter family permease subunit n=1 Tax=Cellulomonas sp. GbtcB1 TaxID=2824746 RepID=UPI001C3080D2